MIYSALFEKKIIQELEENETEETLSAGMYFSTEKLLKYFSIDKLKIEYFKKNSDNVEKFPLPTLIYSCNECANDQGRKDVNHKGEKKKEEKKKNYAGTFAVLTV